MQETAWKAEGEEKTDKKNCGNWRTLSISFLMVKPRRAGTRLDKNIKTT